MRYIIRKTGSIAGRASAKFLPASVPPKLSNILGKAVRLPPPAANLAFEFSYEFSKSAHANSGNVLLRRDFSGFSMELDVSQKTQRQIFFLKTYEPPVTNFMRRNVKKGSNFLDVGGHVGYYSLLASSLSGSGRVAVLEPETANIARLERNIAVNNFKNISLIRSAAGPAKGTAVFHINPLNDGGGSLLEMDSYRDGNESYLRSEIGKNFARPLEETVQIDTLDNIISSLGLAGKIDLIKIDTEGAEPDVLAGAKNELGLNNNIKIICEVSTDRKKVFDLVKSFGFGIYFLNENGGTRPVDDPDKAPKTNFVFMKNRA